MPKYARRLLLLTSSLLLAVSISLLPIAESTILALQKVGGGGTSQSSQSAVNSLNTSNTLSPGSSQSSISDPNAINSIITQNRAVTELKSPVRQAAPENLDYEYALKDNAITITRYKGSSQELTIPDKLTIDGQEYPVTAIAEEAFSFSKTNVVLRKVTLPNSLKIIGERAFINNELIELDLPEQVTSIGNDAFRYNHISTLTISDNSNLQTIGKTAFAYNRLSEVNLPQSLLNLGTRAFSDNGRYVVLRGESAALKTEIIKGAYGAIYKPVKLWIKPIDKTTKQQVAEVFSMQSNLTKELPDQELLYIGNKVVIQPEAQGQYFALQQELELTADFVNQNSPSNPLEVAYSQVQANGQITFSGLELLELNKDAELDLRKGVKALDSLGNDITSRIVVEPETIDTSKVGQYYVTYTVKDDQGNKLSKERKVVIGLDPMKIEIGKGWLMEDFTYDGVTLTGLSELGRVKAKTNFHLVLPDFNPTTKMREKLTKIGEMAFGVTERTPRNELLNFISVVIPDSYEEIGEGAFVHYNTYLSTLSELSLSKNLRIIGEAAFGLQKLKNLVLPKAVTSIGAYAFSENSLVNVDLANVETIGERAFNYNVLETIHIPASVQTLGEAAFSFNMLKTITYAEQSRITELPKEVFAHNQLTELNLPAQNINIGEAAFADNNFNDLTIPSNVKDIGFEAFRDNSDLKTVTLSEGIEAIGSHVFANCQALHFSKLVLPKSLKKIDKVAFRDIRIDELYLQSGLEELGDAAFMGTGLSKLIFDTPNLRKIPSSCFASTVNNEYTNNKVAHHIKELVIPESVTEIGESAFEAVNLETLTLPKNLQTLGKKAFYMNKLKKLVLPENMEHIGGTGDNSSEDAFADNLLEEIVLPKKLKSIYGHVFRNNYLKEIEFPKTLESISGQAFKNNALTKVILPDSLTSLGGDVFAYNKISEVVFPKNLQEIAGFSHNKLTKVDIPASVQAINHSAFASNEISELKIADDAKLQTIHWQAFANNKLTEISLPQTLQSVDDAAFLNNPGWAKMPNKVLINIKDANGKAFNNHSLKQVGPYHVINPGVVTVRHLLKDSTPLQEIAPSENLVLGLGETKEIQAIQSEMYTATSAKQTVTGKQDEQTIDFYYTLKADYEGINCVVKLQHREKNKDNIIGDGKDVGLADTWRVNYDDKEHIAPLLITVSMSGANANKLTEPYICLDFNKTNYSRYIAAIKLPNVDDNNSPIDSHEYTDGKLIVKLKTTSFGSQKTIPLDLQFKKETPKKLVFDLTGATYLGWKNVQLAKATDRLALRYVGEPVSKVEVEAFAKNMASGEKYPSYEKFTLIQNRLVDEDGYLLKEQDDQVQYKMKVELEALSAGLKLRVKLPTYNGKDENGEEKELTAQFIKSENPNWQIDQADSSYVNFSLQYPQGEYSSVQFADLLEKATLTLHYPRAKKNEYISLESQAEFILPSAGLNIYTDDKEDAARNKYANNEAYDKTDLQTATSTSYDVKFEGEVDPGKREIPALELCLRNSAHYGSTEKLLAYNNYPKNIIYYENNEKKSWIMEAEQVRNRLVHDENAFLDVQEEREATFIWAAQITRQVDDEQTVSLKVNELDERMYLSAVKVPEQVQSLKITAYSEKNQSGQVLLTRYISSGNYALPENIYKQTKSLSLEIQSWQAKEDKEKEQVNFAIFSKLTDTKTSLYNKQANFDKHFELKAKAVAKDKTGKIYESEDFERIAVLPNEAYLNLQKKLLADKTEFGPAEKISFALTLEMSGRVDRTYHNLLLQDELPEELEFDNLELSPEFKQACTNLAYKVETENNKKIVKIIADQFDTRSFITQTRHEYTLAAVRLNCHTSPLLSTESQITNTAKLKADDIEEEEDSAVFSSFVAKSLQIVNTVKTEATGEAYALYPQNVKSGEKFTYRMEVVNPFDEDWPNGSPSNESKLELINVLPYHGDKRLVPDKSGVYHERGTNLLKNTKERANTPKRAILTGQVTAIGNTNLADYEIMYSVADSKSTFFAKDIKAYAKNTSLWQTAAEIKQNHSWSKVTAIYIKQKEAKKLTAKSLIQFAIPMQAPTYENYEFDGRKIVSSFALRTANISDFAEGNNVEISLKSNRGSLLINKVWHSYENGSTNPTEHALKGAKFRLWQIYDANKDGTNYRTLGTHKVLVQALTKSEKSTETEVISNSYGKVEFLDLRLDRNYLLEEVEAPVGYEIDPANKYTVISSDKDFTEPNYIKNMTISNKKSYRQQTIRPVYGQVAFTKVDKLNKPLAGAVFKVTIKHTDTKTQQPVKEEFTATSNHNGDVRFFNLPMYGKDATYTLSEVKAPNSLQPIKEQTITFSNVNGEYKQDLGNVVNDKAQLQIYKLALTGFAEQNIALEKLNLNHGSALQGVELTLTDDSGNEIQSNQTDSNGSVLFKDLETDKTYKITEKTAPNGFKQPGSEVTFKIDAQGKLTINGQSTQNDYLVFPNYPNKLTNRIDIVKTSQGTPLAGVEFGLYQIDATGKDTLVSKQTTDKDGKASFIDFGVTKQADGSYTYQEANFELREEQTVQGYLNTFAPYAIQTSTTQPLYRKLSIENPKACLQIEKVDVNTRQPLADAKFALYKDREAEGKPLAEATSNKQGVATFDYAFSENEVYSIKETEAPKSYLLDNKIKVINFTYFKRQANFKGTYKLTWANEPADTQIQVLKLGDDKLTPLASVGFKLQDPQGQEKDREAFTNEHGYATFKGLTANKEYELFESKVLTGYSKIANKKITTEANKQVQVKLYNSLIGGYLQVLKVNETGTSLQGAKFKLEKKVNTEWESVVEKTTATNGLADFGKLTEQEYRLTEIEAPTNYMLVSEPYIFKLTKQANGESKYEISQGNKKLGTLNGYFKVVNKIQGPKVQDIKLTATKVWKGGSAPRPSIYFQLERKVKNSGSSQFEKVAGGLRELANGTISVEFTVPNKNQQGEEYEYRIKEVDAQANDYVPENYKKSESGMQVTNTYTPPTPPTPPAPPTPPPTPPTPPTPSIPSTPSVPPTPSIVVPPDYVESKELEPKIKDNVKRRVMKTGEAKVGEYSIVLALCLLILASVINHKNMKNSNLSQLSK